MRRVSRGRHMQAPLPLPLPLLLLLLLLVVVVGLLLELWWCRDLHTWRLCCNARRHSSRHASSRERWSWLCGFGLLVASGHLRLLRLLCLQPCRVHLSP